MIQTQQGPNGAVTQHSAYQRLLQLANEVRGEMIGAGLISHAEATPAILVLEKIVKEPPSSMTRLMGELRQSTFMVSVNRPVTIRWDRRPYVINLIPQAVPFALAHQLVKKVAADNQTNNGYNINPFSGNKSDESNRRPSLLVISWKGFPDHTGAPQTDPAKAERTQLYAALSRRSKSLQTYEGRYRQSIPPSVDDIFQPNQSSDARPKASQFATSAPEGTLYSDTNRDVLSGYDPRVPVETNPKVIESVMQGKMPPPFPVTEVPAVPVPPNAEQKTELPSAAPRIVQPSQSATVSSPKSTPAELPPSLPSSHSEQPEVEEEAE